MKKKVGNNLIVGLLVFLCFLFNCVHAEEMSIVGKNASLEWFPDGKEILFFTGPEGKIIKLGIDTNSSQELVIDATYDILISPDGFKIAYTVKKNEIWVMNADGSQKKQLLKAEPEKISDWLWSPDSKKIAYVLVEGEKFKVYAIDAETGEKNLIYSE